MLKKRYLTSYAQKLRREMTDEEKKLWYNLLQRFPSPVKRQYVIGKYIVDFVCFETMTVIEVDGIQHLTPEIKISDTERDDYLTELGFHILRYSNKAVRESFHYVAKDILDKSGYSFDDLKPVRAYKRRIPNKTD